MLQTDNNEELSKILAMLLDLRESYDKIIEEDIASTVSTDNNIATVRGGSRLIYDDMIILEISEKVEKVRNEIIQ